MLAPFVRVQEATAVGGTAIAVPPKAGKAPGGLDLTFRLQKAGVYTFWFRAYWGTDGEEACSNSVFVRIDDASPVIVQDATYRAWHWVVVRLPGNRQGTLELAAGTHKIHLTNREDGILLDQILITPWHPDELRRRVPEGVE